MKCECLFQVCDFPMLSCIYCLYSANSVVLFVFGTYKVFKCALSPSVAKDMRNALPDQVCLLPSTSACCLRGHHVVLPFPFMFVYQHQYLRAKRPQLFAASRSPKHHDEGEQEERKGV
jgi:hypothetical protein